MSTRWSPTWRLSRAASHAKLLAVSAVGLTTAGCDGRIGRPELLWLLWLVPLVAVFFFWSARRRQRLLEQFASSELLSRLVGHTSPRRQGVKAGLVVVALSLLLLSLAEIKYGFTWEEVRRRGVDIVVALDVSDSMLVEDAEQGGELSRLERAKREIADLLRLLEGDRIGLVAFAGTAFLECPLTLDYGAAELFLDAIDTDLIPVKGTAIGEALTTSIEAFEDGPDRSRAIILITDGEDHQGEALEVAEMASEREIRIFPIGIGRDEGAPIPQPGGGFRRDRSGEIILSRLDEPTLQRIALTTGGRYVRSVTGDVDLEQIYLQGIKVSLEDQELGASRRERWKERFQWLLAGALVLLMLEPLLSERRRSLPGAAGALAIWWFGLVAWHSTSTPVSAQAGTRQPPGQSQEATSSQEPGSVDADAPAPGEPGRGGALPPDDPYDAYREGYYDEALQGFLDNEVERPTDEDLQLNIGSAHYQMRDYESAVRSYQRAAGSQDPLLRAEALYNLGNTAYRQGKLGDAIDLYMNALELDPDDEDAKFNLEFVREEMKRRQEQQQQQQNQQNQDQQNQDQQDQDQQQDQQQEQQSQEGAQPQDQDGDGLADEVEREGENPTDPNNPDTDGDGRSDGEEDRNGNGRVDEGETDPNRPDDSPQQGQEPSEAQQQPQGEPREMTPEEAERFLQALQEERPDEQRKGKPGRRVRLEKDW